jgi:hypothetical protein
MWFGLWNWSYIIIQNSTNQITAPDSVNIIRCITAQKPEPCNVLEPPGRASFKFEWKNDQAPGSRPDRQGLADRKSIKTRDLIVPWLFDSSYSVMARASHPRFPTVEFLEHLHRISLTHWLLAHSLNCQKLVPSRTAPQGSLTSDSEVYIWTFSIVPVEVFFPGRRSRKMPEKKYKLYFREMPVLPKNPSWSIGGISWRTIGHRSWTDRASVQKVTMTIPWKRSSICNLSSRSDIECIMSSFFNWFICDFPLFGVFKRRQ